jgi:hypothetical protein
MKRFALFLLLLAVGLGVLRWIQGPGPRGTEEPAAGERPWWARADDDAPTGLTPRGALHVNQYLAAAEGGRRPTTLVLDAAASGATEDGNGLYLRDVDLVYLVPGTDTERMRLHAAEALAERVADATGLATRIEREIKLADVEVTVFDGAPVVPLVIRVPELIVDLEARTLASPAAVQLGGPGLDGGGVGLFVDEAADLLRIERTGAIRLEGYGGGGSLVSAGPIEVRRPEPGTNAIEVRATGDAWLGAAPGTDPGAAPVEGLWAHEIVLRGREDPAAGIALETVDAHGAPAGLEQPAAAPDGVRYALGAHELTGGHAHLELDAEGEPRSARITASPRARIALDSDALGSFAGLGGVEPGSPAAPGVVRVESDGALAIDWDAEGTHVAADGPARVFGETAQLFSGGAVTGLVRPGSSGAAFDCTGGVRLERDDAVLVTRELEAELARDADGVPTMSVTARGRPLITAAGEDGRELVLSSEGALWFEQRGDAWTIPRAERIDLTVLGADRLQARADLVEDLDPRDLALRASGNVQVETKEGLARGDRLDVESRERFTLLGADGRRVVFDSVEGHAEAGSVERNGEKVTLRDNVAATLAPGIRAGETYELDCDLLTLERGSVALADDAERRTLRLDASGIREAAVRRPGESLDLVCATLTGHHREELDAQGEPRERFSSFVATDVERAVMERGSENPLRTRLSSDELAATRLERFDASLPGMAVVAGEVVASGSVLFHGTAGDVPFNGNAGEVRVDHLGTLTARAAKDARVLVSGTLPSNGKPYELDARWVRATVDGLEAAEPEIVVLHMDEGTQPEGDEEGAAAVDIRARANHLVSTRDWLELTDDVHVEGITQDAAPWRLDAGQVRFEGRVARGEGVGREDISALTASRGVRLALPESGLVAAGETLRAKRLSGLMRLEGAPARITSPTVVQEADWIELDVNQGNIAGFGRGRAGRRPTEDSTQEDGKQEAGGPWIEYEQGRVLEGPDAHVYVFEEPVIRYRGPELRTFLPSLPSKEITIRASWAVLWVDAQGFAELPGRLGELKEQSAAEEEAADTKQKPRDEPHLFERIRQFGVLNEVYLEGPVEIAIGGQPSATASAIYLDVVSGNGWLADAVFTITSDLIGRDINKIKVQARWLRQTDDYSFFADEAKVSLCEFEVPHLEITTGDLRIIPSALNAEHFEVRLRDNRIQVYERFTLPLPSIDYSTDEEGKPIIRSLKLGNSARFGSFVSAGIVRPAENAGEALHGLLGREDRDPEEVDVDAQYNLDASWLGSRGILLDLGFLAEAEDEYTWLTQLGGIPDGQEDKGFIRVDEDDRDTLRLWLRTRGRYWLEEEGEWVDLAGTWQTDAGVQAEFFESEFTRYEQTETYLRWRRAQNERFLSAAAVWHADHSFSGVSELPTLGAWQGRGEILPLGPASLQYGASAEAVYLRRRESEDGYASPFGDPATYSDGLGDRDALRFDTEHLLEAPIGLGAWGLRATPFALARFTAWSEDQAEADQPLRAFGQVGLRVATVLWKRGSEDRVHQLVPYVSARRDVALEESGGMPVAFDEVENPLEGEFLDVGVRGRIGARKGGALLDLDLRATHVAEVPTGVATGWSELGVFARLSIEPFGVPMQLTHDGRYDVEADDTLYSRLALGLRPTERLAFEAAHYRGLDLDREPLYEAASIHGLFTWTPKWEFEGRQTFSLLDDGDRLGSGMLLRRYGHDIVFEIESSYREGEGASFGINVRPLFTFDRPDLGDISF